MRVLHITDQHLAELSELPDALPAGGFVWVGLTRQELSECLPSVQGWLMRQGCGAVMELHVSDLLNPQLPSHFDTTSLYDILVFRRLATAQTQASAEPDAVTHEHLERRMDTSPVGMVAFDRVLLSVHPQDCLVRDYFAAKIEALQNQHDVRGVSRMPSSPADLMLRMVNHMVDSYLDLRRVLTRDLTALQHVLLNPRGQFRNWNLLLAARDALHRLEELCEDQRSAVQEWLDAMSEWPVGDEGSERERELLRLRSRDVIEHVERVLSHVRRLESTTESAIQMHFSLTGERTNNIMRTLTVLTAIFLPLNLITGVFGMNFDALPLIHSAVGFWIAAALMGGVAVTLGWYFWRKRYLGTQQPR
ncbi:magnesium transporter CorA family protein [Roseateles sp. BYS180W]|uniref:Magnesium transporter CorA family protein n=1 Tax=Roseateles rivi TaxID=3299028 RepID=A0ABW7FUN3_9BURK